MPRGKSHNVEIFHHGLEEQEYSTTFAGSGTNQHQGGREGHRIISGSGWIRADTTGHASRTGGTACPTLSAGSQSAGEGGGTDAADQATATGAGEGRAELPGFKPRYYSGWQQERPRATAGGEEIGCLSVRRISQCIIFLSQLRFCETSAKTANGVNEMMDKMLTDIIQRVPLPDHKGATRLGGSKEPPSKEDSCC